MADLKRGLGGSAGFGENILERNDDEFTPLLNLAEIFPNGLSFFGTTYQGLYLNNNGSVTFAEGIADFTPSVITGSTSNPIIAPFWADVDTRSGPVAATPGGTSQGTNYLWYDIDAATQTFTATWDDVGYYEQRFDKLNAFQLSLTRVGDRDFNIEFRYENIDWVTGDASDGSGGLGGTPARIGYSSGNGVNFLELPQSGDQAALLAMESASNTGEAGVFRFAVRTETGSGTVPGTPGDDVITGGPGVSEAVIQAGLRGSTVTVSNGAPIQVRSVAGTDTLSSIEVIGFVDGRLVFDPADPAAQVVRLYNAALDRGPDQAGLNFYIGFLGGGRSLTDIATGFVASPEFGTRFGTDLPLDQYVTRLYANVLERAPTEGELGYYRDFAARGGTREQMLVGFSESPENQGLTAPLVNNGLWDVNETAAALARLYDTMFARLPDLGGLAFYRAQIDAGTASLLSVVQGFTASPEFQARYGAGASNGDYVDLLYANSLNRVATAEERSYYITRLDSGQLDRATVIISFSESPEHQALTQPDINSDTQFGIAFAG